MCGDLVSNHGTTGRASIERAEARPFPPSPPHTPFTWSHVGGTGANQPNPMLSSHLSPPLASSLSFSLSYFGTLSSSFSFPSLSFVWTFHVSTNRLCHPLRTSSSSSYHPKPTRCNLLNPIHTYYCLLNVVHTFRSSLQPRSISRSCFSFSMSIVFFIPLQFRRNISNHSILELHVSLVSHSSKIALSRDSYFLSFFNEV